MSARVFIGTASPNGLMVSGYVQSLVGMTARLHSAGIGTEYHCIDGPNLPLQRDILAEGFLRSDCSHMLLVGASASFPPDLCQHLLAADRRLVGTVPPRGALDADRLGAALPGAAFGDAVALALDWDVRVLGTVEPVVDGFCRVASLGTSFLLIDRRCFDELARRVDLPRYQSYAGGMEYRAFFRPVGEPEGSPDHAFARRWAAAGGEVWAYAAAELSLVFDARYGVPFTAYLEALRATLGQRAGATVA